jgi:anaerobic magnesium-protoporphyrin IX monomethyl ester cyclase
MKKVVFFNPSLGSEYTKLGNITTVLPPIGICQLSSYVRGHGYDPVIVDASAMGLNHEQAARKILDQNPDYVGFTSTTMSIFNAVAVAELIKKENHSLKIILGGSHVTAAPIETMERFSCFDVGVFAEGELTLVDLLQHLDKNKDVGNVKGLIIRKGKKAVMTEKRDYIKDLDALPFPAYDLLPDLKKFYQPIADKVYRSPTTIVVTSRGCPGRCVFCEKSVFGNVCRSNSTDYVMKLINHLKKNFGINSLIFDEDNFLVFRRRLIEICNRMIDEKIDMPWSCSGRVDMVDADLLRLMKKAGCWQIAYGVESGSQKMLDTMEKGVTVEKNERAIKLTHDAGIQAKASFMIGNLGEDKSTLEETRKFILRVPLNDLNLCRFSPMPGTKAWFMAPEYGRFDPDWKKINIFQSNNFLPKDLTDEYLDVYYKKVYRSFYLRPRILWNYTKKLKDPAQRKNIIQSGMSFMRFAFKK